jgi:hypothetical protein
MIPDDKMRELMDALKERTKTKAIKWRQLRYPEADMAYQCEFPQSTVCLEYVRPEVEANFITLQIRNKLGETVGLLRANQGQKDWAQLGSFLAEVERQVTQWDKVLEDLESQLGLKTGHELKSQL